MKKDEPPAQSKDLQAEVELLREKNFSLRRMCDELAQRAERLEAESRQVEDETHRAREYAESIVQTIHEPLLVLRPNLTVESANPAFFQIFQVTPEETFGKRVYDLGNGQWDIPSLRELLEDVLRANNVFNDYEVHHEFEDIGHRVMLLNARRLDHVQLILLGIRDISEQHGIEEELRKSEAALLAETNALARLSEASSRLWQMRNLQEGLEEILDAAIELLGADMGNIQLLDAERGVLSIAASRGFGADFLEFFREVTAENDSASGRALRSRERSIIEDVDTDAKYAPFRSIARAAGYRAMQSTPLIGWDGAMLGVFSTHFRLPHRPSEQALRRLDLYARQAADFIERYRAEENLTAAKNAAEVASGAKSEFLANMSHEIRTPMTVFMAAVEHLLQIDRNPEHRHLLGMADQSAKRLRSLIDDILDFSRIEARRIDIQQEPFDLRSCVREAVQMFTLAAQEKCLRLEMDVSADAPLLIVGDPDRLGQVLINLIGNAVKFTPVGGIRIGVQPRGNLLEFTVADTGIGIPEEKCELIFESFSQADASFTRSFGGTGLGLAISKGLVELMGGEISVRSEIGKGSVFTFSLPLKVVEIENSSPLEVPARRGGEVPAARILLAEDDPMIRKMITIMLARYGWQAEVAETGRQVIEKWESGNFDLIFMDLQMPEMNGLEATRTIRDREKGGDKRACIIGLTAHARREVRDDCLKAGMDQVLTKPVEMKELYAAVKTCLMG